LIEDVSDTALWVATYRALETERPDALFRDPLAARLAGEKGRRIAERISGSRQTAWSVVIRTCIIDAYIRALLPEVDTVLNLGAGLDTRPYRLELPEALRWIEVDYPHMIQLKDERLRDEKPRCRLERVGLDLADRPARAKFLAGLGSERVLVLTEGVIPYLSVEEAASLADDLRGHARLWITDYISPWVMRLLQRGRRKRQMKNAPFKFKPDDWFGFFAEHGWKPREIRYYAEESEKLGRPVPKPWWAWLLFLFFLFRGREAARRSSGYVVLEPI
jgi:methyltransferase (TIGR00027 family)